MPRIEHRQYLRRQNKQNAKIASARLVSFADWYDDKVKPTSHEWFCPVYDNTFGVVLYYVVQE